MSGAQAAAVAAEEPAAPLTDDPVATARRAGWKPLEEYKGPPERWKPAEDFLQDLDSPAVMRERYKTLDGRYGRMENELRSVRTQLEQQTSTIVTLTGMTRSAEERAYKRARAELLVEQEKAVEAGDKAAFRQTAQQLEDLDKTKPAPAAAAPPANQNQPAPGGTVAQDPAVQAFYQRNPWYNRDPELTKEADHLHVGLLTSRAGLTLGDNLAEVERRMRVLFPHRFGGTQPRQDPANDPGNSRRDDPSDVTPSSGSGSPRRQANRRSFDTIPQESKDAYTRYAAQLKGKGDPLTKEEWATDYWSQFEDDGR